MQIKANMKLVNGMGSREDPDQHVAPEMLATTSLSLLSSHQRCLLLGV